MITQAPKRELTLNFPQAKTVTKAKTSNWLIAIGCYCIKAIKSVGQKIIEGKRQAQTTY